MKIKIAIVGASGYTGAELLRILANHPQAQIVYLSSESKSGIPLSQIYPHLLSVYKDNFVPMQTVLDNAKDLDLVFTALPHGHSIKIAKAVLPFARMIDLGADYRFSDIKTYEAWYKVSHDHPGSGAVYGLCELYAPKIKQARLVANPGCYTTASILSLHPLLKAGLIETDSIVISAASGTTGAGRALKLSSHFSEVFENFSAYGVASHRHTPEIEEQLSISAGEKIALTFTPHLAPMARGILADCYGQAKSGVGYGDIKKAFEIYGDKPFIRLLGNVSPSTKNTRGSNFVDLGYFLDERTGRVIVLAALDNLVKGASGQAVQNMNLMFGVDEQTGLGFAPIYP